MIAPRPPRLYAQPIPAVDAEPALELVNVGLEGTRERCARVRIDRRGVRDRVHLTARDLSERRYREECRDLRQRIRRVLAQVLAPEDQELLARKMTQDPIELAHVVPAVGIRPPRVLARMRGGTA